jgi:ABC-type glycerol-3-phosphate transport system substrate-binding protein
MIPARAVVLVTLLILPAPLGASAADLVVWWEESFTPAEDTAVHELIAAFEDKSGQQVELVRQDVDQQTAAVQAAIDAGRLGLSVRPDCRARDSALGRGRPAGRPNRHH